MSRDYRPFLEDIRLAAEKILRYTAGMDFDQFRGDEKTVDAVLRNLMIVGEAAKQIPEEVRALAPEVEWRRVARFRDIVVHHYFAVDLQIVWDVVANKVPELVSHLADLQGKLPEGREGATKDSAS
jgi:uncharacterized protein with HEPN domain